MLRIEFRAGATLYAAENVWKLAGCRREPEPQCVTISPLKLSILMPVYNERTVVERCIAQVLAAPLPEEMERELIVVDDRSTDGTWAVLETLAVAHPQIRLFRHEANRGKGAAVRTAIEHASGDFSIIQDADLEYDPS